MGKKLKILAIIPARGGSKGLPRKNIRLLAGKPLIAYSIELALKSKYISKTVVSTEDKEIAEISKRYGAQVINRPKELAVDETPMVDVVNHVIDFFKGEGEYFDIVVLLEPTSPLRKENDLDDAIHLFIKNIDKADSLVSVGEVHLEHPYITKKIENGYVKPFFEVKEEITRRQQLTKVYFPYGVIYLSKVETMKKYGTFYQKRTIPYLIERWQNYEIDDIYDFITMESILRNESSRRSDK